MNEPSRQERAWLLKEAMREVLDDPRRRAELKDLMKEAQEEWLEKKWAQFGKWTAAGLGALMLSGLVSLYLWARSKGML